jgi:SAM-dependent methyltransferase
VDEVLREVRGPRVLDVGCASHNVRPGSPRWLHGRLAAAWEGLIGFDPSVEGVRRMRAAGYGGVFVARAEAFALARRFDTIVAGEVIEHLTDPAAFLAGARDHLAPGGRVVGTTPYPFSLLYFLYALTRFPRTCENPEHALWLCPTTIEELARRCGLRLVEWRLVEDYKSGSRSRPYRWLVRFLGLAGRLVPLRLRGNAVLFVMERA